MKTVFLLLTFFLINPTVAPVLNAGSFTGVIKEIDGRVYVRRGDKKIRVRKEYHLTPGDHVVTRDKATCLIDLMETNSFLRLGPQSKLLITKNEIPEIKSGVVWVRKRHGDKQLEIHRPPFTFKTKDASFFIRANEIAVKAGKVHVKMPSEELLMAEHSILSYDESHLPIVRGAGKDEFIEWEEPFE